MDAQTADDVRTLMAKLLGGPDGFPSDKDAEAAFRRLYDTLPHPCAPTEAGVRVQQAVTLLGEVLPIVESLGASDWLTTVTSYIGDARRLLETGGQYPAYLCEVDGCDERFPSLALRVMHDKTHAQ